MQKSERSSRGCTRPRWCNVSCTKRNQKFFGNKILNSKEVKHALKYANESFEMNQLVGMLHEHVLNLTEKSLIPDLQKIVDTKGAFKVGGVMVDMFTASMITQIYDKVNDKNKQKMDKSKIEVLVNLAQNDLKRSRTLLISLKVVQ